MDQTHLGGGVLIALHQPERALQLVPGIEMRHAGAAEPQLVGIVAAVPAAGAFLGFTGHAVRAAAGKRRRLRIRKRTHRLT